MRNVAIIALLLLVSACGLFSSHSNVARPSRLTAFKPTLKVTRVWSRQAGNGTGGYDLVLRPGLAQGTVYVASENGVVAAYGARNGQRVWRKHLKAHITGGVGVGQGLVVVATRRGRVLALRTKNGTLAWRAQASSEVLASPVIGPHGVYVASLDGHVAAFGLSHGKRLWVTSHVEPTLKLYFASRPTLAHDLLYKGYANGAVVALRTRDGRRLWTSVIARSRGSDVVERLIDVAHPIWQQNLVYANAYHGNVVALAAHSGAILWSHPLSSDRNMALGGQSLYVVTTHSRVLALANASGGTLWTQKLLLNRRLGDPALAGPAVVLGDFAGYTQWLSRRTGALVARKRVGEGAIRAAPLVASVVPGLPYVFVLNTNGRLTALRFQPKTT